MAYSIAAGQSGTSAPRWLIVPEQFILVPVWFAPIWIAGLVRLFRNPELRWYWGPPPARAATAILVGYQLSYVTFCGSARVAIHLNNHVGVDDDEQGAPVWICTQLTAPWPAIWPGQKRFG